MEDLTYPDKLAPADKTAVFKPDFIPKSVKSEIIQYNLDYDEDVDAFLNDLNADPEMRNVYIEQMRELKKWAKKGYFEEKNLYPAIIDALYKKDPMDLRAAGKKVEMEEIESSVEPDFGFKAIESNKDVDKMLLHDALRNKYKRWYLDYLSQ